MIGYLLAVGAALGGGWWFLWELPARRSARRAVASIRAEVEQWLAAEAKDNPKDTPWAP